MTVGVGAVGGAASRVRARLGGRGDRYVLCPADGSWFRPLYTGGTCPFCGEPAPGDSPPAPLLVRIDRFWFGMALLALASLAMSALVLYMYFR